MQLRVLGPLQVSTGDRVWSPGGPSERRLLGLLVLHLGEAVSVESLAEALWEGAPPRSAAKTVQVYVTRLRAALEVGQAGDGLVRTVGRGYRLVLPADAVDAYAFVDLVRRARRAVDGGAPQEAERHLVDAFALWRGEPYAEFADGASFAAEAQRLGEVRLAGLEVRLAAGLALGRDADVVAEAQALCTSHPLHEQFWVHLVTALYRCGRQAEALTALRRVRALLAEEIGADPGAELRTLEQRVLRQDPTLATPTHPAAAAPPPAELDPARTVSGVQHMASRSGSLKGQPAPERPIQAGSSAPVDAEEPPPAAPPRSRRRPRWRTRWVAAFAAGTVAAAAATGVVLTRVDHIALAAGNVVSSLNTAGRVTAQLPVGDNPTDVSAADGTIWVTNTDDDTVSRIDPVHGRELVRITGVGHHPSAITVDNGTAWVVSPNDNTLTAINTTVEKAVETVSVGQDPSGVTVGARAVWVTNSIDNTISKIDPNDPHRMRTIPAGTGPTGIAVSDGAVWFTNVGDGTVWKLDPATESRLWVAKVGLDPTAIAVGPSGAWVTNSLDDTVTHLDPANGQVIDTVKVGGGPSGIAVTDTAVWVTTEYAGQVVKIDPGTGTVTERFAVAGAPHGIAPVGDRLWLASGPSYQGHRGGELRVFVTEVTDLEPSHLAYSPPGAAVIVQATSDGLVSYAHAPGIAGGIIVPDLADALPAPGGTEYFFKLRRDIHFSTGQLLRARDVRSSIERFFRAWAPAGSAPLPDVVGADACMRKPATCDLSKGIQIDDTAGTVRIRLARPNSRFLYDLAENILVVPTRTPLTDRSYGPVPGTGPYMVKHFIPGRRVELRRNPYFHQWLRAAQPDGYPDTIVVDVGTGKATAAARAAAINRIRRGELDFIPFDAADLSAAVVDAAARSGQVQLYDVPDLSVGIAILNTRLPPFNDLRVRKALNYAVDRDELARRRMAVGAVKATTTCQVLIPGIGGYRPYCPYTVNPGSGRWRAPDLSTAKELVRKSGTAGQDVTVWEPSTHYDPDGAYFVKVLAALGYRAHLHTPRPSFPRYVEDVLTRGHAQLAVLALSSTPRGDDLVQHLLCPSPDAKHNNSNFGEYCDPRIDKEYDTALRLSLNNGTLANDQWAKIDRQLVDAAPWVPAWNVSTPALASPRVGNITPHFFFAVPLDQLWVR